MGMDIKGHKVGAVMIAEGADIAEEYYFSLLLDRSERRYLAMCSVEGGVDIETLAVERPEALAKVAVDPLVGIDAAKAAEIVAAAGFAEDVAGPVAVAAQPGQLPAAVLRLFGQQLSYGMARQVPAQPHPLDLILDAPRTHRGSA